MVISSFLYVLFFDGEPAILKATQGVKTPENFDFGDASLQTSLAVTTRPSAESLSPTSPIHWNDWLINEVIGRLIDEIINHV